MLHETHSAPGVEECDIRRRKTSTRLFRICGIILKEGEEKKNNSWSFIDRYRYRKSVYDGRVRSVAPCTGWGAKGTDIATASAVDRILQTRRRGWTVRLDPYKRPTIMNTYRYLIANDNAGYLMPSIVSAVTFRNIVAGSS